MYIITIVTTQDFNGDEYITIHNHYKSDIVHIASYLYKAILMFWSFSDTA